MRPVRLLHYASVQPGETEAQTLGCRYTNAEQLPQAQPPRCLRLRPRADKICLAPPGTWKIYYRRMVAAPEEKGP